jgi:hypothetical protein
MVKKEDERLHTKLRHVDIHQIWVVMMIVKIARAEAKAGEVERTTRRLWEMKNWSRAGGSSSSVRSKAASSSACPTTRCRMLAARAGKAVQVWLGHPSTRGHSIGAKFQIQ